MNVICKTHKQSKYFQNVMSCPSLFIITSAEYYNLLVLIIFNNYNYNKTICYVYLKNNNNYKNNFKHTFIC